MTEAGSMLEPAILRISDNYRPGDHHSPISSGAMSIAITEPYAFKIWTSMWWLSHIGLLRRPNVEWAPLELSRTSLLCIVTHLPLNDGRLFSAKALRASSRSSDFRTTS